MSYPKILLDISKQQFAIAFLFIFLTFSYVCEASWSSPVTISTTNENAGNPRIVVDAFGNATAIWEGAVGLNSRILTAYKPNGGSWILNQTPLSDINYDCTNPEIGVDKYGNVTAVWFITRTGYFTVQTATKPFGGSWQTTPDDLSTASSMFPHIAVSKEGNATVIWEGLVNSRYQIQATYRPLGGSWQTPVNISLPGQNANFSSIGIDSFGNVTAVWERYDGQYDRIQAACKPAGGNWQPAEYISMSGGDAINPQVCVSAQGDAGATWARYEGNKKVIQAAEKPFNSPWQTPKDLSSSTRDADYPQVAMSSLNNISTVWFSHDPDGNLIFATGKTNGIWQTPTLLSAIQGTGASAQIGADSLGSATALWTELTPAYQRFIIYASTRPANGNWQAKEMLSATNGDGDTPQIVFDSQDNATAIWVIRLPGSMNFVVQSAEKMAPPRIKKLDPVRGSLLGGTAVTITGYGFRNVTDVRFGSRSVPNYDVLSDTMITLISPPFSPGNNGNNVNVMVTAETGSSLPTQDSQFTYEGGENPILPPRQFVGKVKKNRFATQTEIKHSLKWKASLDERVVGYHLFCNGVLLIDLPKETLKYHIHNRKNAKVIYTLIAYDLEGKESLPISLKLP